mmetsp:Transcript_7343/g.22698  ORF Transcript_7343/g.22698 Transcript_7343/m.22698 type:complete len:260 (-) Transcript_7343:189-968(-)
MQDTGRQTSPSRVTPISRDWKWRAIRRAIAQPPMRQHTLSQMRLPWSRCAPRLNSSRSWLSRAGIPRACSLSSSSFRASTRILSSSSNRIRGNSKCSSMRRPRHFRWLQPAMWSPKPNAPELELPISFRAGHQLEAQAAPAAAAISSTFAPCTRSVLSGSALLPRLQLLAARSRLRDVARSGRWPSALRLVPKRPNERQRSKALTPASTRLEVMKRGKTLTPSWPNSAERPLAPVAHLPSQAQHSKRTVLCLGREIARK